MSALKDITGQKFGRLLVVSRAPNNSANQAVWNCQCDCGNVATVASAKLLFGTTKSCGCHKTDVLKSRGASDLVGASFDGFMVVEKIAGGKNSRWKCICDCGKEFSALRTCISSGKTKSCGCKSQKKHFMQDSPEYRSWTHMKWRCLNENSTQYKYYGGRGITVCESWRSSFQSFYADMGPRPEGTSLDRIDPDGNYEPSNCRWADAGTQSRNRRW